MAQNAPEKSVIKAEEAVFLEVPVCRSNTNKAVVERSASARLPIQQNAEPEKEVASDIDLQLAWAAQRSGRSR